MSLRINDTVPNLDLATDQGNFKLHDFIGDSWTILFSHPKDFTPVCTTEFIAFAEIHPQLRDLNCELMGLSVDSVYSHIAWVRNVKEKMGVEITFPVIADLNKDVATLYGMINPGESSTETSRAVFIIDDLVKPGQHLISLFPASLLHFLATKNYQDHFDFVDGEREL